MTAEDQSAGMPDSRANGSQSLRTEQSPEGLPDGKAGVNSALSAYEKAEQEVFEEFSEDSDFPKDPASAGQLPEGNDNPFAERTLSSDPPEGFVHIEETTGAMEAEQPEQKTENTSQNTGAAEQTNISPDGAKYQPAAQWDDTITLSNDRNESLDLVRVDFGGGKFGYVPEGVKPAVMKDADYTQKTQALAEEKKNLTAVIERERKKLAETVQPFFLEYEAVKYGPSGAGFSKPEPVESEFVTASFDDEERAAQINAFRRAKQEWNKEYADTVNRKAEVQYRQQAAKAENSRIMQEFDNGTGKEWGVTSSGLIPEMMRYINPTITHEQMPMPEDALEIFYKGKHFDELVEKRIAEERSKWVSELEIKPAPKLNIPGNRRAEPKTGKSEEEEAVDFYYS
jgi:hypothetical protein